MHEYYAKNMGRIRKEVDKYLSLIAPELEAAAGKPYAELFDEIWDYYETRLLGWAMRRKDAANAANAAENPGSYETKTQEVPEEGYDFSYHNLVCPQADFARAHGYEEYMPYLCNLDYVMFGALGAPLYREHTCADDGDYAYDAPDR